MGCESLYRLWNSRLARKGIIQFAALVLISQVEWAYLPVAGYLRQMDSRAAELSLTERAIAMESAYYYYGAYLTADSEAVAVGVKDAGTQAAKTEESKTDAGVAEAVESETEAAKTAVDTAGAEKTETEAAKTEVGAAGAEITQTEGAETEDAGGSELTERAELADLEAEGVQDAQTEALEELRIQIVDSDEQGTPAGIQIQPEIQEGMLKEQNRSGNKSTEIPQEEYFKQMLRENGMEDVDNNLTESESGQNEETGQGEEENDGFSQGASSSGFELAAVPAYTYDWTKQWTQDDLRSEFFAVDGSTSMKEEYLNAERLLNEDLILNNEDETQGPQILIYHTHASEDFVDSVPGDPSTTIVGAGERLAELLEEYGFRVLHDTGVYDQERDNAYEKALPAVEQILKENPGIEVVIDLHRDEMANDRRLVMDLQGRPTARFMFFNGLSYLRRQGEISYLENPYILDNLAFSFQAQVLANEYYPGLTRKIYLKAYRYNMHLCPKSMLIELGAQNNTVEEIMNACDPLAHVLAMVLKKR